MSFTNPANPHYPDTNGFHLFRWENTTYSFNNPIVVPKWTLPNCFSHRNSLIIDQKGSYITDQQIIDTIGENMVSVNFCPDLYYTQVFYSNSSTAFRVLENGPYEINGEILQLFPPTGTPLQHMIIHLANIPGGSVSDVGSALSSTLSADFEVIEWAPHYIKGTQITTSRWSAIVAPTEHNHNFSKNPKIIEVMDQKVLIA